MSNERNVINIECINHCIASAGSTRPAGSTRSASPPGPAEPTCLAVQPGRPHTHIIMHPYYNHGICSDSRYFATNLQATCFENCLKCFKPLLFARKCKGFNFVDEVGLNGIRRDSWTIAGSDVIHATLQSPNEEFSMGNAMMGSNVVRWGGFLKLCLQFAGIQRRCRDKLSKPAE